MVPLVRTWLRSSARGIRGLLPVRRVASSRLPTDYGDFDIHVYRTWLGGGTHVALVRGEIGNGADLMTRVHSACLTGDVFHSARCDCGAQLDASLRRIAMCWADSDTIRPCTGILP